MKVKLKSIKRLLNEGSYFLEDGTLQNEDGNVCVDPTELHKLSNVIEVTKVANVYTDEDGHVWSIEELIIDERTSLMDEVNDLIKQNQKLIDRVRALDSELADK